MDNSSKYINKEKQKQISENKEEGTFISGAALLVSRVINIVS